MTVGAGAVPIIRLGRSRMIVNPRAYPRKQCRDGASRVIADHGQTWVAFVARLSAERNVSFLGGFSQVE